MFIPCNLSVSVFRVSSGKHPGLKPQSAGSSLVFPRIALCVLSFLRTFPSNRARTEETHLFEGPNPRRGAHREPPQTTEMTGLFTASGGKPPCEMLITSNEPNPR